MGCERHTAKGAHVGGPTILQGGSQSWLGPETIRGGRGLPAGLPALLPPLPQLWHHAGHGRTGLVDEGGAGHLLPVQGSRPNPVEHYGSKPLQ